MHAITMDQRIARAIMIGGVGGGVALAITLGDPLFRGEVGFVRAAACGAFLAGLLVARGMGGAGLRGWFQSALTFAAATVLGAAFAVPILILDGWLMETRFMASLGDLAALVLVGPVYVLAAVLETYMIWAVWAAGFIALQGRLVWGRL